MLAAYFDDSGTHGTSRAVVWGGFVGTTEQWADLDSKWRALLRQPLPSKSELTKFGTADCAGRHGAFRTYNQAEVDRLQFLFRQIIVDSGVVGLAFSADRLRWDQLVRGVAREVLGSAEMVCFGECIRGAMRVVRQHFSKETEIGLYFDQGRRSDELDRQIDIWRSGYEGTPEVVDYAFLPVEKFPPLQAADMLATYNYWQARESLEGGTDVPPGPHFKHFLGRIKATGEICDEPGIRLTLRANGFDEKGELAETFRKV